MNFYKMNKEGSSVPKFLVAIVLVVLVLVVAFFSIGLFFKSNPLGLIPGFEPTPENVRYTGRESLLYPGEIVYKLVGNDANMYFFYNINSEFSSVGWMWQAVGNDEIALIDRERNLGWVSVENQRALFNEIKSEKNKNTIISLVGKSAEEGLKLLVERTLANEEGNIFYDVELGVFIGRGENKFTQTYSADDKRLNDLDGLIIKFNQLSRGVVEAAKNG